MAASEARGEALKPHFPYEGRVAQGLGLRLMRAVSKSLWEMSNTCCDRMFGQPLFNHLSLDCYELILKDHLHMVCSIVKAELFYRLLLLMSD